MSGVAGHVVVGTPAYLSPEALNHERANPAFDLWSLSVTFYEVLTGRRPFDAASQDELPAAIRAGQWTPVEKHLPSCPAGLASFFSTALAPDPGLRPKSTQQLARRMSALLAPS